MKIKNQILKIAIAVILIVFIANCKKEEIKKDDTNTTITKTINGFAQKGPFITGSSVTVYELQEDLTATGKSYNAVITDNKGAFSAENIELSSNYVSLRADGFYFNEVLGDQSVAQITLYALADVSNQSSININILTTIEKPRVEYLMKDGKSFSEAKSQAEQEILAIFNIEKNDINNFESLDIAQSGEDNGILLTITSVIQGYNSESELTSLIADISDDIKLDGKIDDTGLGKKLITNANNIKADEIASNLSKRYEELGVTAKIPEFGEYLTQFIENTEFEPEQSLISYPDKGIYAENILSLTRTEIVANKYISIDAFIPKGLTLMIKISGLTPTDTTIYESIDSVLYPYTIIYNKVAWSYSWGTQINWAITNFSVENCTQTFTSIESDKECDLQIKFEPGEFLIEYFENNSTEPTRSKIIKAK